MNNSIVPGFDDENLGTLTLEIKRISTVPNGLYVRIEGEIDTFNSIKFTRTMGKCVMASFRYFIFDCTSLNYLSSTGVGAFIDFLKTVNNRSGILILCKMHNKIFDVFQLLGFDQFFTYSKSIIDSISLLQKKIDTIAEAIEIVPPVFPHIITCPFCNHKYKISKAGRYKCSQCSTKFIIDANGRLHLH